MDAIKITDLTKFYGTSRGIIHLNLNVEQGEFFGFIGPNGAGKSTTIRTLLGLVTPTSGSAEIFGKKYLKGAEVYPADHRLPAIRNGILSRYAGERNIETVCRFTKYGLHCKSRHSLRSITA